MKEDLIKKLMCSEAGMQGSRGYVREGLKGIALRAIFDAMKEEVTDLCGRFYHPNEEMQNRRAGSTRGRIYYEGQMEEITRPRVRGKDGKERQIKTYQEASDMGKAIEDILRAVAAGVSSRDVELLHPGTKGFSSSNVNRYWVKHGIKYFEELRNRRIETPMLIMMIDGVVLSDELVALIAMGIDEHGNKMMLDFEVGNRENYETSLSLLKRLEARKIGFGGQPLFILDGSEALDKAVLRHYGEETLIQRCLVHKESNLKKYLSRKDWPELARLFARLRKVQGPKTAREALHSLRVFLANKNKEARNSLEEAGERLITLHLLNTPSTLNKSLLSTNAIENTMLNFRRKTRRVTRWNPASDMPHRWIAYAMLSIEQGFRKIKGYKDLPELKKILKWNPETFTKAA